MLGDALAYPRQDEDWLTTVAIGGVLTLLGALFFFPILPVYGYFAGVLRSAIADDDPPAFEDWETLFVDGIKLFAVGFVYVIVPTIIMGIVFAAAGVAFAAAAVGGSEGLAAGVGLFGLLLVLVVVVVFSVAFYLLPAAIAHFAYTDDLSEAFDVGTVTDVAFTSEYFVALLVAFLLGITLGLVASLLTLLVVGFFLQFYVQVATMYIVGRGYAKARGLDGDGGDPTGTPGDPAAV